MYVCESILLNVSYFYIQELDLKLERRKRFSVAEPALFDESVPTNQQSSAFENQRKEASSGEPKKDSSHPRNITRGSICIIHFETF